MGEWNSSNTFVDNLEMALFWGYMFSPKNFKGLPLNLRLPSEMYEGHMDITKWLLRAFFKSKQHRRYMSNNNHLF